MYPLKFMPVYKDYLWGGRNLANLGKQLPKEGNVAESWEVSCHPEGLSIVANGEYAGQSLQNLVAQKQEDVLGSIVSERYGTKFPLLVKLIDANQKLSVQVHPDDAYALRHENEFGKHEIWYIITAKPGARVIYGVIPRMTKEGFIQAIREKRVESCLQSLEVTAGDVIDIPPGTIHALGEGIVLAEIQQNSNATYRVYDYGRVDAKGNLRELHIDKALDVINFESVLPCEKKARMVEAGPDCDNTVLTSNSYFQVDLMRIHGTVRENTERKRFYIYTAIEGAGMIRTSMDEVRMKKGESVLVPAACDAYRISGDFQVLKSYVVS